MDCPLDERDQFGAVPFGLTQFASYFTTLPVDQQGCRHARNGEVVRSPPRGIEKDRQLFDPDFSIEILDGLDPFAVDGQPYDLEVFAAESTL